MFNKLRYRLAIFMQGRYGVDPLSRFLSTIVIALLLLNIVFNRFLAFPGIMALTQIAGFLNAALIFIIYFRTFSRNIPRRYAENRKFLALKEKCALFLHRERRNARQRIEYHIYKCPHCSQKIRIPRGKGRIMVRCPKCGTEFIKQS